MWAPLRGRCRAGKIVALMGGIKGFLRVAEVVRFHSGVPSRAKVEKKRVWTDRKGPAVVDCVHVYTRQSWESRTGGCNTDAGRCSDRFEASRERSSGGPCPRRNTGRKPRSSSLRLRRSRGFESERALARRVEWALARSRRFLRKLPVGYGGAARSIPEYIRCHKFLLHSQKVEIW